MLPLIHEISDIAYFVPNKVTFQSKAAEELQILEIDTNRSWAPDSCRKHLEPLSHLV